MVVWIISVLQREAKLQLFREAVDAYSALTNQVDTQNQTELFLISFYLVNIKLLILLSCFVQALKGHGIDSHLLGLKLQAIEEGRSIPKIFMDTAYGLATHWKLRTGQVSFCVCLCWSTGGYKVDQRSRKWDFFFLWLWHHMREVVSMLFCNTWCLLSHLVSTKCILGIPSRQTAPLVSQRDANQWWLLATDLAESRSWCCFCGLV